MRKIFPLFFLFCALVPELRAASLSAPSQGPGSLAHAPETSPSEDIIETYEPSEGQAYPVWVIRHADSKVRSVFYTDLNGDGHRTEYVYDRFGRLGEVRHTDTTVAQSGAKTPHTVVEGFGYDSKMNYVVLWKTETGLPTLNYNYWYDAGEASKRYFRVKEAGDGPERGSGREVLDAEGRVTGRLFKDPDGRVTRTTFQYYSEKGLPYVREQTWKEGIPANFAPDEIKIHRLVSGVRLLETRTRQRFAPEDRRSARERQITRYRYNL